MSMLHSSAGSGADDKLYVEDVFSTYLYTGNGSTQTINNGIDLAGKGGMVWIKGRSVISSNTIYDTTRGISSRLITNITNGVLAGNLTSFNSNGITLSAANAGELINATGDLMASWTFRKAPKFFDIVTYTGNGVAGRQIPHNLGCEVGMIIVKNTGSTTDWLVWHRGGEQLQKSGAALNSTGSYGNLSNYIWGASLNGVPDMTTSYFTVGSVAEVNATGHTYVAYLYAHDTSADGIIQCGSYVGNGTTQEINLGWEPQYLMVKSATHVIDWQVVDNMRGITDSNTVTLEPNTSDAERSTFDCRIKLNSLGFTPVLNTNEFNATGQTYIYLAIRRPMKVPTSGTEVYNAIARTGTGTTTQLSCGFSIDLLISSIRDISGWYSGVFFDRLRGKSVFSTTVSTATEAGNINQLTSFDQNGITVGADVSGWINYSGRTYINHFFKRAKGFMTITAHTDLTSSDVIAHDLGVTPEMIFAKCRSTAEDWYIYHKDLTSGYTLKFTTDAEASDASRFTGLSATQFTYGGGTAARTRIFYSFATLAGISKVFTFTADVSKTINCGFTTGARFIMLKKKNGTGSFYIWDSVRGIVSGNDPYLLLNSIAAEVTTTDLIDPEASGFISNFTDGSVYVGYAIS